MTVKEMRELLGLTQEQFAQKYNIPKRSIQNWESGERKPPEYVVELLERAVKEDVREKRTMKKISLIHFSAEKKLNSKNDKDLDYFNYAMVNDGDPEVIKEMELIPENLAEAKAWLAGKKNTKTLVHGFAMDFYMIDAYGIEYWEEDEEGNYVDGGNYDCADDEEC